MIELIEWKYTKADSKWHQLPAFVKPSLVACLSTYRVQLEGKTVDLCHILGTGFEILVEGTTTEIWKKLHATE